MTAGDGFDRFTTSEAVAQRLRVDIQRGLIDPGTRLRQSEIAARFGVSTTPVREAFALLQSDGLVRIDPHRGAIVFRPSAVDVSESYEIREALETLAIKLAIPRFTPDGLDHLQALVDAMTTASDHDHWIELNNSFHLATYEPSGRPRLCGMIANLRQGSASYVHLYLSNQAPYSDVNQEHQDIVNACRNHDVRGATAAVRAHLRHTVQAVTKFLEQQTSK